MISVKNVDSRLLWLKVIQDKIVPLDKTSHAWCMVFIDNKWSLYDPTWDAGQSVSFNQPVNTIYFKVSPSVFIQSHMPFDPMFQLLNYPLTYKEFNNGNIKSKNNSVLF